LACGGLDKAFGRDGIVKLRNLPRKNTEFHGIMKITCTSVIFRGQDTPLARTSVAETMIEARAGLADEI
jgi:hypothetical protein